MRLLFGSDIFVSYSRADSATYAARLASELVARGFDCRLDQWGARPGSELPPELLRDLRRCSMLVVVGSAGSGKSSAVEKEIREFLPTGRFIVPVDIDGSIRSARWWPLLQGLAVVEEKPDDGQSATLPSAQTIERIVNTASFTRRSLRLRRISFAVLVLLGALIGASVIAGGLAIQETAREVAATKQRVDAEQRRNEVLQQLSKAQESLKQQTAVAESRELAREASDETESEGQLTKAILAGERQPTEAARQALIEAIQTLMSKTGRGPHAVSKDGRRVAVAAKHGQGYFADAEGGRKIFLCGSPENIVFLSFSPDDKYLLVVRYQHKLPGENRNAYAYQLWSTASGSPLGSTETEGYPDQVFWSPDSSLFLAFVEKNLASYAYRMTISASGEMKAADQPVVSYLRFHNGVAFGEKRRVFLIHSEYGGASLWDYDGHRIWTSSQRGVGWVGFENHDSYLVLASPASENTPDREFEVLALDARGMPTGNSTFYPASPFLYRLLRDDKGDLPKYTIVPLLEARRPDLAGNACNQMDVSFRAGLVVCGPLDGTPVVLDLTTFQSLGSLEPWTYEFPEYSKFSPDGKTFVVASAEKWLTAWDTASRKLLWKKPARAGKIEFQESGQRVLVQEHGPFRWIALDARSGKELGFVPDDSEGRLEWTDASATRMIISQGGLSAGQPLSLWDVEHSKPLQRFELLDEDKAEQERDAAVLNGSASVPALLEIAHRRLRVCNSLRGPK